MKRRPRTSGTAYVVIAREQASAEQTARLGPQHTRLGLVKKPCVGTLVSSVWRGRVRRSDGRELEKTEMSNGRPSYT